MLFHLILPGLLWPNRVLRDAARDLPLSSLAWLLGRGHLRWQAPQPLENWLCRELGCGQQTPPSAALRLLGEGVDPGNHIWLCIDPVHLHFAQERPNLSGAELGISTEEMRQLATALAPLFRELGELSVGAPGHGYLKLRTLPRMRTVPPSAVIGSSHVLPSGIDAAVWLRLGNEAQMMLHALPLNAQREATGRPTLNSLWFWGAGVLPPRATEPTHPYNCIVGRQALLPGLANWSGVVHRDTAPDAETLLNEPQATQLLLDDLLAPTQQHDSNTWRLALVDIERHWLQPLRAALRYGRLNNLRVTALGDEATFDLTLTRAAALRFWRRPQPLHELSTPPAFPT